MYAEVTPQSSVLSRSQCCETSCSVMEVMAGKLVLVLVLAWSLLHLSCALTYRDCFCGQKRQIHGLIEVN